MGDKKTQNLYLNVPVEQFFEEPGRKPKIAEKQETKTAKNANHSLPMYVNYITLTKLSPEEDTAYIIRATIQISSTLMNPWQKDSMDRPYYVERREKIIGQIDELEKKHDVKLDQGEWSFDQD